MDPVAMHINIHQIFATLGALLTSQLAMTDIDIHAHTHKRDMTIVCFCISISCKNSENACSNLAIPIPTIIQQL